MAGCFFMSSIRCSVFFFAHRVSGIVFFPQQNHCCGLWSVRDFICVLSRNKVQIFFFLSFGKVFLLICSTEPWVAGLNRNPGKLFHIIPSAYVCVSVCVHAAGIARPAALCHRNSSKWGGWNESPSFTADHISDAFLSAHQPQALHFNAVPHRSPRPNIWVHGSPDSCRGIPLCCKCYWVTLCFLWAKGQV